MNLARLKRRVDDRDRLVAMASAVEHDVHEVALSALAQGDLGAAEQALLQSRVQVQRLAESLRVYQAELRAQAEELAASKQRTESLLTRFAALFANLPVATLLIGANGEVLDHNARAQALLALRAAAGPRFLHRLVEAEHWQHHVRPACLAAAAEGAATLTDVPFIAEDRRRFFGELHLALLPVPPGEPACLACTVIDRSEHLGHLRALRQAADALRTREGFLAETAKVARIAGWELPADGGPLRASPALHALFGLPDGAPAHLESVIACCNNHTAATLRDAVVAAQRDGRPFELELDVRTPRGHALRVLAAGHAEAGEQGGRRVFGVFQDVSQQHAARRRIDQLTERLNLATDAGGIGIWDWDLRHRRLFVDHRIAELIGETDALNLHDAFAGRLPAADMQALDNALLAALDGDGRLAIELPLQRCADGREHWVHLAGRVERDAAGRPRRVLGCLWDCTPEHEAARLRTERESAVLASREKTAMLSRVSHELRTPLNAILGFAQLMRLEAEGGDLVLKPHRVELIEHAARHLLALVNEVLDVSQAETGRMALKPEPVLLPALVAECLPLVQGAADAAGVALVDRCAESPAFAVRADRLRLKQVLLNLLSNAVKYNQPGGHVQLSVAAAGPGQAELRVADSGRGLSPEQLAGLFQPFNRLGAESTGIEGSGMGLFVSQRLVELMGGHISAASEPGRGTTFAVRLDLS